MIFCAESNNDREKRWAEQYQAEKRHRTDVFNAQREAVRVLYQY